MSAKPLDWHHTVRRHWRNTTAFLLAGTEPCITIRDDELRAIKQNRVLVGLSLDDLDAWQPPASWMLAVLVCPGETTEGIAAWARKRKADPRRIHFYLHPKTSGEAMRAWHDAGYPLDRVDDDVGSWERLHKLFGLALSDRIVEDWNETASRRPTS